MLDLLTMDEAAKATSVSRDTIKRRLRKGDFPGAVKGKAHGDRPAPWLIPVIDLVSAGFTITSPPVQGAPEPTDPSVMAVRLARSEAVLSARDIHLADLRAEIRRLHEHIELLASSRTDDHAIAPRDDCLTCMAKHESGLPK